MNCVGRALALQQVRTVVCALVQRFRFRTPSGEKLDLKAYEAQIKDYFVASRPSLRAVLDLREQNVQS